MTTTEDFMKKHAAWIVEVADTKEGTCSPTFLGPFVDREAAEKFAESYSMGTHGDSGYSEYYIVGGSDDAHQSPEQYATDYAWRFDEWAYYLGKPIDHPDYSPPPVVTWDPDLHAWRVENHDGQTS
jgi:hypothetical protein